MQMKIYYDPVLKNWLAFVPPEKRAFTLKANTKPLVGAHYFEGHERAAYEKAYAEAKSNALEVGNWEVIQEMPGIGGESKDGIVYWTWKGSAVIKDGKYILSV